MTEAPALTGFIALTDKMAQRAGARQPAAYRRYSGASLQDLRLALRKKLPYRDAMVARMLLAAQEVRRIDLDRAGSAARLIKIITDALLVSAGDRNMSSAEQASIAEVLAALTPGFKLPDNLKTRISRFQDEHSAPDAAEWEHTLGFDREELAAARAQVHSVVHPTPIESLNQLPVNTAGQTADSTAALLLKGARHDRSRQSQEELAPDLSQTKIKLLEVSLTSFRGIAGTTSLPLNRSGKPASVLIFGDNGVGKSSVVDGIEFALQGRVGRSHDFNSSFAPVLRHLAWQSELAAQVTLSDGNTVKRWLRLSPLGRQEAVGPPVSPGFRWAPITLKRSDLLRFQESDALARGSVFFDYFPGDAEAMGSRPDEQFLALEERFFTLRVRRTALTYQVATVLEVTEDAISNAEGLNRVLREHIFGGLTLKEAREQGAWDRMDENLRNQILELRDAMVEYTRTKAQLDKGVQILNPRAYARQAAQLSTVMDEVAANLTASFLQITRAQHVQHIHVLAGQTGPVSLDLVVELSNGQKAFPQQVFSEGYRDLLALLFFLAVAQTSQRRGQAKILVLDDIFQSVDAGVRHGAMAYVLDQFHDWQLIITVHDRLWYEQLRALMRRRGHGYVEHRLVDWQFGVGPKIDGMTDELRSGLDLALSAKNAALTCAAAGRLLEAVASEESWRLGISVHRKRDDKYTLADLWPGLVKYFKKSDIIDLCLEIDGYSELRNLAGAHYNDFAASLSWQEAEAFGQAVLSLYELLHCDSCSDWLIQKVSAEAACRCGKSSVRFR